MTSIVENWRCVMSRKIPIKGSPWNIVGDSWAARCTIFLIPELGIAFDVGQKSEQHPTHIFISHAHCDHTDGLPALLLEPTTPTVIVPKPAVPFIKNLVNSYHKSTKYNDNASVKWKIIEALIPLNAREDEYVTLQEKLEIKNIKFEVELIKSKHTIPTTGYGLIELRTKLDDKYIGLTQEQINEAKLRGENITKIVKIPHICYLGDTTHHVFYLDKNCTLVNPRLEKYGTILVECTFLFNTDEEKNQAKNKKHMHWENLRIYIESHPNINFIISHFSTRYNPKQIIDFFSKVNLPNVFPLVHDLEEYWTQKLMSKFKNTCINCGKVTVDDLVPLELTSMSESKSTLMLQLELTPLNKSTNIDMENNYLKETQLMSLEDNKQSKIITHIQNELSMENDQMENQQMESEVHNVLHLNK